MRVCKIVHIESDNEITSSYTLDSGYTFYDICGKFQIEDRIGFSWTLGCVARITPLGPNPAYQVGTYHLWIMI